MLTSKLVVTVKKTTKGRGLHQVNEKHHPRLVDSVMTNQLCWMMMALSSALIPFIRMVNFWLSGSVFDGIYRCWVLGEGGKAEKLEKTLRRPQNMGENQL